MKKLVAVIAIVAFLGGMSAPIIANDNASLTVIELTDKDGEKKKKSDKKSAECATNETAEKKSSDCTTAKKSPCAKTCDDKK